MKLGTSTATAVLCIVAGLTAPAFAIDLSVGAGAGVGVSLGTGEGGASLDTDMSVDADVGVDGGLGGTDDQIAVSAGVDGSAEGSAGASVSLDGAGDDASVVAEVDLVDRVIKLIESSEWHETSLSGNLDLSGAAAYDLDNWLTADTRAELKAAVEANSDDLEKLHIALASNAQIAAWLNAHGSDAEDVVAVGVTGDGSVAVFTTTQ